MTNPDQSHKCIVCDSTAHSPLYDLLRRCNDCGFIWAPTDISPEQAKSIYGRSYFFGDEYLDYLLEAPVLRKDFQRFSRILKRFVPSGTLFEVGCSFGIFLDTVRDIYQVRGMDINEDGCRYAHETLKLDATCGDFLSTDLPNNSFNVVVAWATFEHLIHPELFLQKISQILKPGGIFACTVPDIGSTLARMRGRAWRQIHPPTHVSYFTEGSLSRLFHRYGLEPVYASHVGQHRSVDITLYTIFVLHRRMNNFYNLLKNVGLARGSYYLNTYDTLLMVGKKH
jgi:SAM-dependent methyltransferase